MAKVTLDGSTYEVEKGETVLGALLRHGVHAPSSCRMGACQTCLMRATRGAVPPASQYGLKDSMKARGYFLACVCKPEQDLELKGAGADVQVSAAIVGLDKLSPSVVRVRFKTEREFDYRPGQYAVILRQDGLARSYSIASLTSEEAIEMHVRKLPNGRMSTWLFDEAVVGEKVVLQGPSGECFYVAGQPEQPLLLAGTGTGLAPLYGIVRDALAQGHTGPIWLFHGAVEPSGLYLVNELRAIAATHPNVTYVPCVLKGEEAGEVRVGALDQVLFKELPKLKGFRAFVCGDPGLVAALKKKIFLAGAPLREIYADAFVPSAV
ncbi:MAG: 2Fe-2S iron-sulfur cluster binding domain-containing protein [Polyangiaceae bacterium]|nr:2Fe-2S iron-sulfur cluster binding domain-containing protein [Polyangiaceae bacterium]